jgi:hypothetical protein
MKINANLYIIESEFTKSVVKLEPGSVIPPTAVPLPIEVISFYRFYFNNPHTNKVIIHDVLDDTLEQAKFFASIQLNLLNKIHPAKYIITAQEVSVKNQNLLLGELTPIVL